MWILRKSQCAAEKESTCFLWKGRKAETCFVGYCGKDEDLQRSLWWYQTSLSQLLSFCFLNSGFELQQSLIKSSIRCLLHSHPSKSWLLEPTLSYLGNPGWQELYSSCGQPCLLGEVPVEQGEGEIMHAMMDSQSCWAFVGLEHNKDRCVNLCPVPVRCLNCYRLVGATKLTSCRAKREGRVDWYAHPAVLLLSLPLLFWRLKKLDFFFYTAAACMIVR